MTEFILYSRSYCHLCDDMLAAFNALCADAIPVQVIDVDHDPALVALYDELVPVLVGVREGVATRLCHYFLDQDRVRAYLQDAGLASN